MKHKQIAQILDKHLEMWRIAIRQMYHHGDHSPWQIELKINKAENFANIKDAFTDEPTRQDWVRLIRSLPLHFRKLDNKYYHYCECPEHIILALKNAALEVENVED
jgi:hypothetical protein